MTEWGGTSATQSITVSWSRVPGATGYRCRLLGYVGTPVPYAEPSLTSLTTTATRCAVGRLPRTFRYAVAVSALSVLGESQPAVVTEP